MLERLDDQQRRRTLRRIRFADYVLQIPTFARRYRTGCEKTNQPPVYSSREIFLVFGVHKRIERDQPAKSSSSCPRSQPLDTKLGCLTFEGVAEIGRDLEINTCPSSLIYAGAQLLGTIAARVPVW